VRFCIRRQGALRRNARAEHESGRKNANEWQSVRAWGFGPGLRGANQGASEATGRSGRVCSAVNENVRCTGMAIAIVKDGKLVMAKGYGVRKMGEAAPVDETRCSESVRTPRRLPRRRWRHWWMKGRFRGTTKYMNGFPDLQCTTRTFRMKLTIRDLLTHRSGMGLGEGDLLFWPHTTFTREEIIYKLRFMKPASSFRSKFAYDNLLYIAAGQIIPAVTGKNVGAVHYRKDFAALWEWKTTTLSNAQFPVGANFALPHSKLGGPLRPD